MVHKAFERKKRKIETAIERHRQPFYAPFALTLEGLSRFRIYIISGSFGQLVISSLYLR